MVITSCVFINPETRGLFYVPYNLAFYKGNMILLFGGLFVLWPPSNDLGGGYNPRPDKLGGGIFLSH